MELEPNKAAVLKTTANETTDRTVRNVTLICKNHLDVGFTESAAKVTHDAINWMLPVAIQQSRTLREESQGDNFVWTTPAWTIYEALERHRGDSLKSVERACEEGDIAWHALPFTTHTELMDEELFEFGLSLAHTLDTRFGKKTIAAKMTDVPGHTRSIIPLMARAGVRFLHIGVNHMSAVPMVPPAFRWRDPETLDEIVVYYSLGYGGDHHLAGHDAVLAFRMVGDNMEIPSLPDIQEWLKSARSKFPEACVRFGRMDDYVQTLDPVLATLPVVEGEIGDSWIHGTGTDPWKVAHFRELLRLRKEWLRAGKLLKSSPTYVNFSRPLLLVAEHTWGVSITPHLQETKYYSNQQFIARRHRGNYKNCEASWQEQRDYIEDSVLSITAPDLKAEINKRFQTMKPLRPELSGFVEVEPKAPIAGEGFSFKLDPKTGSIIEGELRGHQLASGSQATGLLRYQGMHTAMLDRFRKRYCGTDAPWAALDFGKPGLRPEDAFGGIWDAQLMKLFRRDTPSQTTLLMQMAFDHELVERAGAPAEIWVELAASNIMPMLSWNVQWFDKTATRLPEALWFSIAPPVEDNSFWRMQKMNRLISPTEVIARGGRRLHAVESLVHTNPSEPWRITALDSALVAPGDLDFLNFDDRQPDLSNGWHFNLWNNIWGTNFPQWYEQDARFRFEMGLD